jgi:hypothetical protein
MSKDTPETPTPETPAPKPETPTQPDKTQELQAQLATLTRERDEALAQVNGLTSRVSEQEAAAEAARNALVNVHRGSLLAGAIDPDVAKLAPALDIGPDWAPTADSVKALNEWKAQKAHFFRAQGEPLTTAPGTPEAPRAPAPSTPPVDKSGNAMTLTKWKQLERDNPREFRQRWPEYVAYMAANQHQA